MFKAPHHRLALSATICRGQARNPSLCCSLPAPARLGSLVGTLLCPLENAYWVADDKRPTGPWLQTLGSEHRGESCGVWEMLTPSSAGFGERGLGVLNYIQGPPAPVRREGGFTLIPLTLAFGCNLSDFPQHVPYFGSSCVCVSVFRFYK